MMVIKSRRGTRSWRGHRWQCTCVCWLEQSDGDLNKLVCLLMWRELPEEVLATHVLPHLSVNDVVHGAGVVCRSWHSAATQDRLLWRSLYYRDFFFNVGDGERGCADDGDRVLLQTAPFPASRDASSAAAAAAEIDWRVFYIRGFIISYGEDVVQLENMALHHPGLCHRPRAGHACIFLPPSPTTAEPRIAVFGGYTTNYCRTFDIDVVSVAKARSRSADAELEGGGSGGGGGGGGGSGGVLGAITRCVPTPSNRRIPLQSVLPGWLQTVAHVGGKVYVFGGSSYEGDASESSELWRLDPADLRPANLRMGAGREVKGLLWPCAQVVSSSNHPAGGGVPAAAPDGPGGGGSIRSGAGDASGAPAPPAAAGPSAGGEDEPAPALASAAAAAAEAPSPSPSPSGRYGHSSTAAHNDAGFYVFGGQCNGEHLNDLWWFDAATERWEEITPAPVGPHSSPPPSPRHCHGACLVRIGGGRGVDGSSGGGDDHVLVFGGWSKVPTTPEGAPGGTSFSMRDAFHNDLHAYNTRTRVWTTVIAGGRVPEPRCQSAFFAIVAGAPRAGAGAAASGSSRTDTAGGIDEGGNTYVVLFGGAAHRKGTQFGSNAYVLRNMCHTRP